MKQVLIIGNGFDLACGLKSSYSDFFDWRFKGLFKVMTGESEFVWLKRKVLQFKKANEDNWLEFFEDEFLFLIEQKVDSLEKMNQLNESVDIQKKLLDWFSFQKITIWDCLFLLARFYIADDQLVQWTDIENIIYNIVSIALVTDFKSNLKYSKKEKTISHIDKYFNEDDALNALRAPSIKSKDTFIQYVKLMVVAPSKSKEDIANALLNSLYEFEDIFAEFIKSCVDDKKIGIYNYKECAKDLVAAILKTGSDDTIPPNLSVDVLSFNYTLCYFKNKYKNNFKMNSWRNIHGVAQYKEINKLKAPFDKVSAPIFGIDNHDILNDKIDNDLRIMFTKAYRLIDNDVNSINNDAGYGYNKTDVITVYGHSLGKADYSYFETIFDENNLYDSNTKLQVYYHAKRDENNIESKHNCINAVVNLLNNYGQSLGDAHGENIVNKMILENRLEVLPSTNLNINFGGF
ncbi:AbiH family protein [Lactobacillus sp. ESL0791]|uniref:AbiH family protein n=1 Tax=Lactobacillus sp. ESL0791 TaxID=2983234 RepID=UPI0023F6A8DC|nr:AbiH family protein [Lactobacillus sp. ESL0791]MDF7639287.1 AbiH family protein [Lactobacillus sp. ESL0791]